MLTNEELVVALEARGITPQDLEDTVMAINLDRHAAELAQCSTDESKAALTEALAAETEALTVSGLRAQISWLDSYYTEREHLAWALAGYLNLPIAA